MGRTYIVSWLESRKTIASAGFLIGISSDGHSTGMLDGEFIENRVDALRGSAMNLIPRFLTTK
jgi:hypothetical protein